MSYYFIHDTEDTTNRIGGYLAPNPFHTAYPYAPSDTDAFDAPIAHYVEDTHLQESHEATATMSSSQSESDVSSVFAYSQSDEIMNVQMAETVDAEDSSPPEETLSDSESVEEIHPSKYPMLLTTHSLAMKKNRDRPCTNASFKPPSNNPSEVKICTPPPDRKPISEALGQVKYKFRSPGLSPYSQDLIVFEDPSAPSGTPGVSMSQILKGDRGCVDMSDLVPDKLPEISCYIDVVFRAPGYQPQYIRIPTVCRHTNKIRPTYYNLAYAISDGYKEILQVLTPPVSLARILFPDIHGRERKQTDFVRGRGMGNYCLS
ncbi:hypothetical protein IW261DRAFT_418051 [Armillaria novae-zelandiae]|uniref:Uncharacterized protein n=1 Tax=Armillaria novae-zelandiae TaxID=153914 RepID=A0AA39P2E3_9AGAR|nr:hypothetical protein IW261DRAFT_418051 [Armillaria novae-zelandiae]